MKCISVLFFGLSVLCLTGSCSGSKHRVAEGAPYTLTGTLWQDSATVDTIVTLVIDRHETVFLPDGDSLPAVSEVVLPVADGHFSFKGTSPIDADELYLYDQHGHVAYLYGTSGARLEVEVLQDGSVRQSQSSSGSSAARQSSSEPDKALLRVLSLRDSIPLINDSLRVRRILGGMPEAAKPAWLMSSINLMLDRMSRGLSKSTRLPRAEVQTPDTLYPILGNRVESLLLFFWSPDVPASRDSLEVFSRIARDYGLYNFAGSFPKDKSSSRRPKAHRIVLMSLCLQSDTAACPDLSDLPGLHAVLPGGYAHPLSVACQVHHLPSVVLVDRFGNYQVHDVWGTDLYNWLDKTPLNSDINKLLKK